MQNRLRRKPSYPIETVDNALQLIQMLRDLGVLRLKDIVEELHVAPSTAHRLMAMLVYRGFAIQDEARRYLPGPAMHVGPARMSWTKELRAVAQPYLELLAMDLNETVNLMVRVGTKVRFLSTVEGSNILRVGDRQGEVLPADKASGGKAMLAEMSPQIVINLFRSRAAEMAGDAIPEEEMPLFVRDLAQVRDLGYAVNSEETEVGVSALGVALHGGSGRAIGALSVAVPAMRFRRIFDEVLVPHILDIRQRIDSDIATSQIEPD